MGALPSVEVGQVWADVSSNPVRVVAVKDGRAHLMYMDDDRDPVWEDVSKIVEFLTLQKVVPLSPECDRMSAVRHESQTIGEFLEWLGQQGVNLMRWKSIEHSRPCQRTVSSKHQIAREDVARLEAELRGADPDLVSVPPEYHPESCDCKGTNLITWTEEGWEFARPSFSGDPIQGWLADYFNIDLKKVERERRAILKRLEQEAK